MHLSLCRLLELEYAPGEEFPEGGPAAIRNLDTDPFLGIQEEEAESWQQCVASNSGSGRPEDAAALRGLSSAEVRRQEHIYEFVATEASHCQVLRAVQKIFAEGMRKYLAMPADVVDRLFPRLDDLMTLHFR